MARLNLDLPDSFPFASEMDVVVGQINYGGHLGNDAMLSLVHEARVRFLKHLGYAENDVEGVGILMVDAMVIYRSEVFYGDRLTIEVAVSDLGRSGCDILYRVTSGRSGAEAARAKTGVVFFDYEDRKVVRVPAGFVAAATERGGA